ncbi:MAG TPA: hypothetical protein VFJ51_05545 [Nitrososphaeraceae archaeon]|nr:hypothetical protein [Nitrososphaeraceae archaeon]
MACVEDNLQNTPREVSSHNWIVFVGVSVMVIGSVLDTDLQSILV